tara:strand:+ start:7453 stop:8286 length:834 start_codon:yes stop_codon:yes gene_type:complete
MKVKHNKKRNTAFVYEALVREGTTAILKQDRLKRGKVVELIKKHFGTESVLRKDLDCYRSLYESQNLSAHISEKILKEATLQKRLIDPGELFKKQTALIKDVNQKISPSVFNNFVPNYKTIATINQMFSSKVSPKNKVILENQVMQRMLATKPTDPNLEHIDDIVYKSVVQKFNEKYESTLLEEQKTLLTYYITSFADNALELKIFLNEEISRLKEKLTKAKEEDIIKSDERMRTNTEQLIEELKSFAKTNINQEVLITILKTQTLVKELGENGDSN